jgi:hypothetical protein
MDKLEPVGYGYFGAIYDQFGGRIRESVLFLSSQETGEAVGVFHRVELGVGVLGDIDVVWGDLSKGLSHAIDKHVINHSDFNSVEELASVMESVLTGGEVKLSADSRRAHIRATIGNKRYVVVLCLDIEDSNGVILCAKNWVVTIYDESFKTKHKKRRAAFGAGPLTASPP